MKSILLKSMLASMLFSGSGLLNHVHAQFSPNGFNYYQNSAASMRNFSRVSNQALWNAQLLQNHAINSQYYGGYGYGNYASTPYYGNGGYANGGYGGGFLPPIPAYSPSPIQPYGDPYAAASQINPYLQGSGYGAGYGAGAGYGGYGSYDPYGYASYGQALTGSANLVTAYGKLSNTYEKARLMREEWQQARIETQKKQFDLDMYIKANTPTYTETQARNAKLTLQRIRTNSLPGEIATGKSLNYLLDDLRKVPGKKTSVEPMMLSEGILSSLNVTRNTYGMGLLRNFGIFTWPVALQEPELLRAEKRKDLDERIRTLVRAANNDRLDVISLKDIRDEMAKIGTSVRDKVNDIPTAQYLDAKQFLQDFYDATIALERGEAPVQAQYQRFIEGGKSAQDVVDYMISNGLRFGPSTTRDEFAYRAMYSVLASYDIAMNAHAPVAKE